jgi:hypothetical protein
VTSGKRIETPIVVSPSKMKSAAPRGWLRKRECPMILSIVVFSLVGGMVLVLGGVLAIAGRESRQEEELTRRLSESSRKAA